MGAVLLALPPAALQAYRSPWRAYEHNFQLDTGRAYCYTHWCPVVRLGGGNKERRLSHRSTERAATKGETCCTALLVGLHSNPPTRDY